MRGKFSNFRWRAVAFFMALLLVFPFLSSLSVDAASQAARDRLREAQQRQQEARQQVRDQQNLLEGTYAEMSGILAEIQELDSQMDYALDTLLTIEITLLETELRIAEAMEDLEAAQNDRDLQYEMFRARLRAMYMAGPLGWVEILLQAESFADLFLRIEYVNAISQADAERLERLQDAENLVTATLDRLSSEYNILATLRHREQMAIDELDRLLEERQAWFDELEYDAERQAEMLAIMQATEHAVNVEFGLAQAQYRTEVAAAEQRRREEARRAQEAARAAEIAALGDFNGVFMWPLPSHPPIESNISSPFGNRPNPFNRSQTQWHSGVDVPAPAGTRIVAAADGIVRTAGWLGGYGLTVIIDHCSTYSTLYAHNSRNRVTVGQRVSRGDHIADVGTTGNSTGNHLHFEIRRNGTAVNPLQYFR